MGRASLSEEKKQLLRRLYADGMKVKAIAKQLGISKPCADRWCHKLGLRRHGIVCLSCDNKLTNPRQQYCNTCRRDREKLSPYEYGGAYGGSSSCVPGHEDRIEAYTRLASLYLPLFNRSNRNSIG